MPNLDHNSNLIKFHRLMVKVFTPDELYTLCFYLEINYHELVGMGISGMVRELILLMGRLNRFADLQQVVKTERPDFDWPDITSAKPPSSQETHLGDISVSAQGNIIGSAIGKDSSVHAENIAGRDININYIFEPSDSPTSFSVLSNQIDKLGESLSVQVQQRLVTLKDAWRKGNRQETLYELQELRKDTDIWAALSDEAKAEYLCFEGSIQLHLTGDVHIAIEFANKAHNLTPTSNEARLRASIAYIEGQLNKAIEILADSTDVESLHLKAAFYLELGNPVQSIQILESVGISSQSTAETYRLRALSYLVQKDIKQAQLEIQKALEISPLWERIRFSAVLIDYYSVLSLGGFDDPIVISAEPISWTLIKRDDESLAKLSQATKRLHELMQLDKQTQKEIDRLRAWYLACLASHPDKQNEAALYCQSLLNESPAFIPAIRWALARGYKFDLDISEIALEELTTNDQVSVYELITLSNCYLANQKLEKVTELLEANESLYREQNATEVWMLAFAQAQVLNGSSEIALQKINDYEQDTKTFHARMLMLHALAQETNDWQELNDFLNNIHIDIDNPNILLDICEIKAEQQDWPFIIDNLETLLQHFKTAEVLRLIIIAAYNSEHFHLCLQLLDDNRHLFPNSKFPLQLRQIRISCQSVLGLLPQAILDAATLASESPTLENLIPLINLYITKGDLKGLVLAARQLESLSILPSEVALQVSRLLVSEDRRLALSLWEKATTQELPDELVGEAYFLGHQLGLKTELKQLSLKLQKLGQEGRGGIYFGPANEILEMLNKGQEQRAKVDEAYRAGQIPVHFVSQEFNRPLATLYHANLLENEKISDFCNGQRLVKIKVTKDD